MFEGKEIKVKSQFGTLYNAIVISCVKDVGISIIDADSPDLFLFCLRMKNAPNFWSKRGQIEYTRKQFTIVRKGIINGFVNMNDLSAFDIGDNASAQKCPFGQ